MTAPHIVLSALAQWLREPPIYDLPFTSDEIDLVAAQAKAQSDRIKQLEAAVLSLDERTDPALPVCVEILEGPHKGVIVTVRRAKEA